MTSGFDSDGRGGTALEMDRASIFLMARVREEAGELDTRTA